MAILVPPPVLPLLSASPLPLLAVSLLPLTTVHRDSDRPALCT